MCIRDRFKIDQLSPKKRKQRELANYLIEVGGAPKSLLRAKGYSYMVIKQVGEEPVSYTHLPIGRKLDFIIQEMNREVNTIGSKAMDITLIDHVVQLKCELEKVREQVQNIE